MPSITSPIEMQVQNKVAELIAAKNTIYELIQSSDPSISLQAAELMNTQNYLQEQLGALVPKTNNPSLTDAPEMIAFYYAMITHLDSVQALKDSATGIPAKSGSTWKLVLASACILGVIILRRK